MIHWFKVQIWAQHQKLPRKLPHLIQSLTDASINQSIASINYSHQSITPISDMVISRSDSDSAWKTTPDRCLMSHNTKSQSIASINQSIASIHHSHQSITRINQSLASLPTHNASTCMSIRGHWTLHFAGHSQIQGPWVSYKLILKKSISTKTHFRHLSRHQHYHLQQKLALQHSQASSRSRAQIDRHRFHTDRHELHSSGFYSFSCEHTYRTT